MSRMPTKVVKMYQVIAGDIVKILTPYGRKPVSIRQIASEVGHSRRACKQALELLEGEGVVKESPFGGYYLLKKEVPEKLEAAAKVNPNIPPERLRAMVISKFMLGLVENPHHVAQKMGKSHRWATKMVEELVAEGRIRLVSHGKYEYVNQSSPSVLQPQPQPDPWDPALGTSPT